MLPSQCWLELCAPEIPKHTFENLCGKGLCIWQEFGLAACWSRVCSSLHRCWAVLSGAWTCCCFCSASDFQFKSYWFGGVVWLGGFVMDGESRRAPEVQQLMCSKSSDSLAELSELRAGKLVTCGQVEKMGTQCLSGLPTPSSTSVCIG